jgi:hypothetical protein
VIRASLGRQVKLACRVLLGHRVNKELRAFKASLVRRVSLGRKVLLGHKVFREYRV